jgi:hypothetical protein
LFSHACILIWQGLRSRYIFMAVYSFVPYFREAKFCGVPSSVWHIKLSREWKKFAETDPEITSPRPMTLPRMRWRVTSVLPIVRNLKVLFLNRLKLRNTQNKFHENPSHHSRVLSCKNGHIPQWPSRPSSRMRTESSVMSTSPYLTNSKFRHVGITIIKLKVLLWASLQWHNSIKSFIRSRLFISPKANDKWRMPWTGA